VPVISGVGHETDFTITDFVADLRAPTPTAAAELAVPDQAELRLGLGESRTRLARSVQSIISDQNWKMENYSTQIARLSPLSQISNGRQRLDELNGRIDRGMGTIIKTSRDLCLAYQARMSALNPEAILKRGYSIVTAEDGATVYQVGQTSSGEHLQVRVSDGEFTVVVVN